MAIRTQGSELYALYNGEILTVKGVTSIDGLGAPREQIDVTPLEVDDREFLAGLASPGAATFNINTDTRQTSHMELYALYESGETIQWALGWSDGKGIVPTVDDTGDEPVLVLPNTRSWIGFNGYLSDYPFSFAGNAAVTSSISLQLSGKRSLKKKGV